MPRSVHSRQSPAIDCYACGHAYDHLGTSPHPGVCPACGQRATSFAGTVEILHVAAVGSDHGSRPTDASDGGGTTITDPTNRLPKARAPESESPDDSAVSQTLSESETFDTDAGGQPYLFTVRLSDATDRRLSLVVAVDDHDTRVLVARFEDTRVTPTMGTWGANLLPPAVAETLGKHVMLTRPVRVQGHAPPTRSSRALPVGPLREGDDGA